MVKASPLFRWDNKKKRFIRPNGRMVSKAEVTRLRGDYIAYERTINERLAKRLFTKEITIQEWYTEMRSNVRRTFSTQYALGKGGFGNMTSSDYGILGNQLKKQYKFLDQFAADLTAGKYTTDQIDKVIWRQQLYMESSLQAYERGKAASYNINLPAYPADGSSPCIGNCKCEWIIVEKKDRFEATWKLGATERHCDVCPMRAVAWSPYVVMKE